jgi:hypothetical protein
MAHLILASQDQILHAEIVDKTESIGAISADSFGGIGVGETVFDCFDA